MRGGVMHYVHKSSVNILELFSFSHVFHFGFRKISPILQILLKWTLIYAKALIRGSVMHKVNNSDTPFHMFLFGG